MKKFILVALALVSLSTFAKEKVLIECTTPGDALGAVEIKESSKGNQVVVVTGLDDVSTVYKVQSNYKAASKTKQVIVAAKDFDNVFGGAIMDALMLEISADKKSAVMADRSSVFIMNCF